ncbi:hypothetical protein GcM1_186027 [Golovinomyces cichoracearum]|uniref:Uncharacterized protein n=1 Tax=Golovinomyces cichoracearum TaxID=62708 RepID=A0A420J2Y8_9PEZI|nr:hypothetical protein GcM1_186027 [Golovinomyces cichoracearum]
MQQNLTISEQAGRDGSLPGKCDVNKANCKQHEVEKLLINDHAKSIFVKKGVKYGLLIEMMQSNISFFAAEKTDIGGEGADGIIAACIDKAHSTLPMSSSFDQLITIRPGDSVQDMLSKIDDVMEKADQPIQSKDQYFTVQRLLSEKNNSKRLLDVNESSISWGDKFSGAEIISLIYDMAVTIYGIKNGRD